MSFVKEFKEFISRGNLIDLATAVVIGGAFGKVSTSMVNDIVMPPLGLLLGKVNFSELKIVLLKSEVAGTPDVSLNYGSFLQNCFDFVVVAFVIFMVIKAYNRLRRNEEAAPETPAAPPAPTKEEILLTEIRDLLAKK